MHIFKIESTNIVTNIGYKNVIHRKSKKHCVDTLPLYCKTNDLPYKHNWIVSLYSINAGLLESAKISSTFRDNYSNSSDLNLTALKLNTR